MFGVRAVILSLFLGFFGIYGCSRVDADEDGWDERLDCDDHDPLVHPGAGSACLASYAPPCDGDLKSLLLDVLWQAPDRDSDGYVRVDSSAVAAIGESLSAAWVANIDGAQDWAEEAGYRICRLQGRSVVAWVPDSAHRGAPIWFVNTHPLARGLVLEVPHPLYDIGTPDQGRAGFLVSQGRALIVAGSHRCASFTPSGCDGSTSACGAISGPYPVSDSAHIATELFHFVHTRIAAQWPSTVIFSLHGMTDTGVSISNGTTTTIASDAPRVIPDVVAAYQRNFPTATVTTCNDYAGAPIQERLCGTTNVQGRQLNGATDPCISAATDVSHRFVHVEQDSELRDYPDSFAALLQELFP